MSTSISRRLRPKRLAGLVASLAFALAMLAPMMLGPALGPLTAALGGTVEHRCACGMAARGECACPECAQIEHRRLREHAPVPYPVLQSQCGGDEAAPGFAALPLAVEPASTVEVLAAEGSVEVRCVPARAASREDTEPFTPPPRRSVG